MECELSENLLTEFLTEEKQSSLFPESEQINSWLLDACELLDVAPQSSGWQDKFGANAHKFLRKKIKKPINTLSLFSGAGGLDIGFHDSGFNIIEMVEIEDKFVDTLRKNSGHDAYLGRANPVCIDIRQYDPEFSFPIDFIIGGPPCQTFSAAGRRAEGVKGTTDQRGTLFEEYVRLLKKLRPKAFLFENVYGIIGAEGGEAWRLIQDSFKKAGYSIYSRILDAADYGVPQHRERLIIVGVQNGIEYRFPVPTHGPDSPSCLKHFGAKHAISDVESQLASCGLNGRYGHLLAEIPPGLNYSYFTKEMGHPNPIFAWRSKFSDFLYKADPKSPVRTIKAQGGQYTGPFHWDGRKFTAAEFKRLQTFPDAYEITGGQQAIVHQIGNSVPPQMARILALSILQQLFPVERCDLLTLPLLSPLQQLTFRKRKRELTAHYKKTATSNIEAAASKPSAKKDKTAIEKLAKRNSYIAVLGDRFSWKRSPQFSEGCLHVDVGYTQSTWAISVKSASNTISPSNEVIKINIKGRSKKFALSGVNVTLSTDALREESFTAMWKAFEAELIERHIKADLVQLSGYYQYPCSFVAEMSVSTRNWKWRALQKIVSGLAVGQTLPKEEMEERLSIERGRMLEFSSWLKKMGYEIRNSNTNPQIPPGAFLIPYCFPTLTPMSVQLNKSLEEKQV